MMQGVLYNDQELQNEQWLRRIDKLSSSEMNGFQAPWRINYWKHLLNTSYIPDTILNGIQAILYLLPYLYETMPWEDY